MSIVDQVHDVAVADGVILGINYVVVYGME